MKRNVKSTRSIGLMTWLATHILSATLVYVLAVFLALGEPVRAAVATTAPADEESRSTTSSEPQQLDPNLIQLCYYNEEKCEPWAPPPLLNLDQQIYFASAAQRSSLRELEKQAVANVISDHSLTDADTIAVQTWGRYEALAELYALLTLAITTTNRSPDQQNAVDWLAGIMKQKAIASADSAGREFVRWAGLDMSTYETLLRSDASESQLRDFLNDNPQLNAFCNYVPPTPYGSDYSAASHPICLSQGLSCRGANFGLDCNPPTPSYDQFVKYGQARASYEFLNSAQFSHVANAGAKAFGLAIAVAAGIGIGAGAALPVGATVASIAAAASASGTGGATVAGIGNAVFPFTGTLGAAGTIAGVAAIVIVAIIIAVMVGISVISASELPGQLAELIREARTTTPDAKDLLKDHNGATTFFAFFVGATLPEPDFRACDNANPGLPPGITVIAGILTYVGAPCLNPSAIPPPAATDLKFLVQEQGGTAITETPTISYRDAQTGAATTARLSKNWFVATSSEKTTQTLTISYTDWDGETRNAWLMGKPTAGYKFVTFAPAESIDDSADLDPDTCDDDGTCTADDALEYLGSDGKKYSAKVRGPAVPTGEAKFAPLVPAEGSPQSFIANGFSFTDAVGPLTYEWRFQNGGCNFGTGGCMGPDPNGAPQLVPSYGDPVSGESVTHTWTLAGTFLVELTAIDSRGIKGSRAFPVTVENVPPTLLVDSECITDPSGIPLFFCNPRTVALGESVTMSGVFDDVGTGTYNRLTINWGDGTSDSQCISPPGLGVCFHVIVVGQPDPLQLGRLTDSYRFNGSHTYARPGSYYGAVTVNDPMGGSKSEPFLITIKGLAQSINFPGLAAHTFGDAPFGISATGGDSDQPVTFTVTGSQAVCALSGGGTGGVTVSLLKAGTCSITANQSGSGNYDPAASVTQSFTINRAPLTITASSPTITYGAAVPPITPGYSAFAGTESATSLDTQPTCSAASNGGAAGSYATSCTGAVDPNYDFNYMSGTLKIEKASTTLALTAAPATAVKGQPIAFTATVGITSPGATNPSGTVDFSDGGATIAGCAGLPVSAATNSATCTTSAMTVGSHSVTASYSGDTNFNSSNTAAAIASTVNKAATTTTASAPGTSIKGQSLTLTATIAVTAPGAGLPAGTVTFLDGTTSLGTGQLSVVNGKVQGSFSTSALALGRHAITARYGGNGDFTTSTSAPIIHYVNTDVSGFPTLAGGTYDLTNANLMSAYLVGVSLTGATVAGANFMGATLINADLTGADVSGSNFRNANFTGANLTGVRFSNTNLLGATGLSTATLTNVVWINTVCPNGRNSDRNGGSCEGQW